MIVAEQKQLEEIKSLIAEAERVLIVGCGTCVTVCFAGGTKEAAILGSSLRMTTRLNGDEKVIDEITVQRQCEWEYIDPLEAKLDDYDLVLSLGCGIGVQTLAERFPTKRFVPGLNTTFLGFPTEQGIWEERCQACGNCILHLTGAVCPISRCSKQLLNGPCGGTDDGKCEVDSQKDCAWSLIYQRLKEQDRLDLMQKYHPIKNYNVLPRPKITTVVAETGGSDGIKVTASA